MDALAVHLVRLHPIGYVLSTIFATWFMWSSVLIGSTLNWVIHRYGGVKAYRKGRPATTTGALAETMRQREIQITIDLAVGKAERTVWTCDMSQGYIQVNAEYHT